MIRVRLENASVDQKPPKCISLRFISISVKMVRVASSLSCLFTQLMLPKMK